MVIGYWFLSFVNLLWPWLLTTGCDAILAQACNDRPSPPFATLFAPKRSSGPMAAGPDCSTNRADTWPSDQQITRFHQDIVTLNKDIVTKGFDAERPSMPIIVRSKLARSPKDLVEHKNNTSMRKTPFFGSLDSCAPSLEAMSHTAGTSTSWASLPSLDEVTEDEEREEGGGEDKNIEDTVDLEEEDTASFALVSCTHLVMGLKCLRTKWGIVE